LNKNGNPRRAGGLARPVRGPQLCGGAEPLYTTGQYRTLSTYDLSSMACDLRGIAVTVR